MVKVSMESNAVANVTDPLNMRSYTAQHVFKRVQQQCVRQTLFHQKHGGLWRA